MSNGVITGCLPGDYERECTQEIIQEYKKLVAQQQTRIDTLEKLADQYQTLADKQEELIKELNEKPARLLQHIKSCTETCRAICNDSSKSDHDRTAAYYATEAFRALLDSVVEQAMRPEATQETGN